MGRALEVVLAQFSKKKKRGAGYMVVCPAHKDKTASLGVTQGKRGVVMHCLAGCELSDVLAAIKLRHRDLFDDVSLATGFPVKAVQAEGPVLPSCEELMLARSQLRESLAGISSLFTFNGNPGLAYLRSRGLDLGEDYGGDVKFHRSWLGLGAAIVFAVRDGHGSLVGAQGRFLDPRADPRMKSKGVMKLGCFMTPGAMDADVVGVTEAPIDAISLALCGLPSLALLGAGNVNKPWFWPGVRARRIVLATDADSAGERAADVLRRDFGDARCVRFAFPPGVNDANDFMLSDVCLFAACVKFAL